VIGFELDLRQFSDGCQDMNRAGGDMRPVWKALRPLVRADVNEHFAQREGSSSGWPGYAASTLLRIKESKGIVRKRGKRRGQLTRKGERRVGNMLGRIKSAWLFRSTGTEWIMTNRVPWSDVHQQGGTAGGSSIPKREFAWVSEKTIEVAAELMQAHVMEAW
jgi:hypothetical protein